MASILRPFTLLSLVLGALSSPVANEPNGHQLFERATCKDNLGRCFNPTGTASKDIASRSAATAFCSSFLSIPVVTSTIATTTPFTLIKVTDTVVASTEVQTSVETATDVATETTQQTVTTQAPVAVTTVLKRDVSTADPPKCGTGYSPFQYSSACSCVSVTPSTTYVTATASLVRSCSIDVVSVTVTTTTVSTSTETIATKTITETSIVTSTGSPPATLCSAAANPFLTNGKSFTKYCSKYYSRGTMLTSISNVDSFSDCIGLCATNDGCVYGYLVTGAGYFDRRTCYLYRDFTLANLGASNGVDSFSLDP